MKPAGARGFVPRCPRVPRLLQATGSRPVRQGGNILEFQYRTPGQQQTDALHSFARTCSELKPRPESSPGQGWEMAMGNLHPTSISRAGIFP
jgi:hypothetical protein